MARNGSGTYSRAVASYVYNTTIDQVTVNSEMDDIASALTASIAKNGETTPTANLPMGTYRHTGVGNGSARTDYAAMGQAQDGKINWVDGGGTADAITATYSPVITALVDGQLCYVRATLANATTTPTFSPNGLTARTIVKNGGVALVAGDIVGDGHELILRYDLTNTRWELLNPAPDLSSKQPLEATLTSLSGLSLVAGDILYATAADTLQRLAKGTASQQLRMNSGATAPEWATITGTIAAGTPLVMSPYVADNTATQAHGLSSTPVFTTAILECLTAEYGYSIGDKINMSALGWPTGGTASNSIFISGANLIINATNLVLLTSSRPSVVHKTLFSLGIITAANWKLTITPYALA